MRTLEQDTRSGRRSNVANVNADGSVAAGTGFAVTKTGTGTYSVKFFGYRNIFAATAEVTGGGAALTAIAISTGDTVAVTTMTTAGAASNTAFMLTIDGLVLA